MPEASEESRSQEFALRGALDSLRRRPFHFLIPMFLGWLLVWGASWVLPARFKSGTLILVEQPTMPKDYVTPNVTDNLQERLQSITQQILSRTRLVRIIDMFGLYAGEHTGLTADEKVERMRKDIDIDLVRNAQNQIMAFNIYYSAREPHVAQQVTSELTNLFINENVEVRQQASEDTTKFLESHLETARQSLAEQEAKIREFKGEHVGELPTQLASNLQILSGLQSQLQAEEDALNAARQQQVYLESLLNQYRTLQGPGGNGDNAQMTLAGMDQELEKLRTELADLSSRYTESHPDVRKLKTQIAKTEKAREQLEFDLKSARNHPGNEGNAAKTARDGGDLAPGSPVAQLQSQLQANQAEVKNRERSLVVLKAKIADYQARLNQEPMREQQLADLARDYDQTKASYDELLKKKNESAMATSMELLQQGERFRVIDPPSLPVKPEFPNRLKFCAVGLAVGLMLGAGMVGAFEMMDDRVYDEKELKDLLPVGVIVEIPVVSNASAERSAKKKLWLGWATATVVFAAILAGSFFSYFRG
jgi:polysaccharide biosynthesis transport protein